MLEPEEGFRGYFPGSRTPLPTDSTPPSPEQQETPRISHRPVTKWHNGQPTEFFTIGAVSEALQRPLVTVRLWERKGYLPKATFRLPDKTTSDGRRVAGRRLYTRAQVDAIVKVAEARGIAGSARVDWSAHHPAFAEEIRAEWNNTNNTTNHTRNAAEGEPKENR